jgi:hypothetical protein
MGICHRDAGFSDADRTLLNEVDLIDCHDITSVNTDEF